MLSVLVWKTPTRKITGTSGLRVPKLKQEPKLVIYIESANCLILTVDECFYTAYKCM